MLDMHVHLTGHQDRPASEENIRDYLEKASSAGLKAIGFADHDYYLQDLNLPLIKEIAQEYPHLQVAIGLEVDYRPGEEEKIQKILESFPFDYVIGSVHEIDGWLFDYPEEEPRHWEKDPDEMYREYFRRVEMAASSGLFTTIGHLDLIKIFGVRPKTDVLELADQVLEAIRKKDLVIEINTAGRFKPVGEYYPEEKILKEAWRRKIPVTLGSDAHQGIHVGRDLELGCKVLKSIGYRECIGFSQREKKIYPLD